MEEYKCEFYIVETETVYDGIGMPHWNKHHMCNKGVKNPYTQHTACMGDCTKCERDR